MTRNATDPAEGCPLSPQQTQVIERLLAGETVPGAAREVGVSRETFHRWLRADWTFRRRCAGGNGVNRRMDVRRAPRQGIVSAEGGLDRLSLGDPRHRPSRRGEGLTPS
jgi:hypothetical protein